MNIEASANHGPSARFDHINKTVKYFPNYVLRLEAQSEEDARLLKDLFGDKFKTDPPIVHLEFDKVVVVMYNDPQPCKSQVELGLK